jgi:hypothetical protein
VATSGLLYQPQMSGEGDCGAIGGMKIGRGSRSTRRKAAPAPLCPPQIPLDETRDRTRAAAVGSQRLTAWAMARPSEAPYWTRSWVSSTQSINIPNIHFMPLILYCDFKSPLSRRFSCRGFVCLYIASKIGATPSGHHNLTDFAVLTE